MTQTASFIAANKFAFFTALLLDTFHILDYLTVIRFCLRNSEAAVGICGIAAKSEICGMDIHADVDYTCPDDSSLYVVGLVLLSLR